MFPSEVNIRTERRSPSFLPDLVVCENWLPLPQIHCLEWKQIPRKRPRDGNSRCKRWDRGDPGLPIEKLYVYGPSNEWSSSSSLSRLTFNSFIFLEQKRGSLSLFEIGRKSIRIEQGRRSLC